MVSRDSEGTHLTEVDQRLLAVHPHMGIRVATERDQQRHELRQLIGRREHRRRPQPRHQRAHVSRTRRSYRIVLRP